MKMSFSARPPYIPLPLLKPPPELTPRMKTLLVGTRNILQPRNSKTAIRMGSLVSPARELRTLAQCPQLAISKAKDDPEIRAKYRPFLLDAELEATDWISQLELETTIAMAEENLAETESRLKVLVLYGSLRKRYKPCPRASNNRSI